MSAEQEQVAALAQVLPCIEGCYYEELLDRHSHSCTSWRHHSARKVLASGWLAEHDAQVRAEATAAVATLADAWDDPDPERGDPDKADALRAALTPDAGAALRAREAKAWDEGFESDYEGDGWPPQPLPRRPGSEGVVSEHGAEKDAGLRAELAEALAADLADQPQPQRCGHSSDPMCCPYTNFPTLAAFFVEAEKPLTSTSGFDPWEES